VGIRIRPNADGTVDMGLAMAEMRLKQGRYRMAAEQARACLDQKPKSGPCQSVLARALANVGQCEAAVELFGELRSRRAWNKDTAVAEGQCHLKLGRPSAAIAAFEEATALAPAAANPKYQLAAAYMRVGDWEAAEGELDALEGARNAMAMPGLARAVWSLETGEGNFDAEIRELLDRPDLSASARIQIHLLEGRMWMDVGDPWAAGPEIRDGVMYSISNVRAVSYRAEAVRRQGDPWSSLEMLDRQWFLETESPIRDAIRARVLVDLGQMEEAEALLVQMADPGQSEALASRWYLASHLEDPAGAADLAGIWRWLVPNPQRRLEQLYPAE